MSVVGLHHAGVYVTNLDRSIAFYGDAFGLEVAERISLANEKIAFLHVGPARLELLEHGRAQRPTGVVDHVAFEVDDLDALLAHLRKHGVTLLDDTPLPVPALAARILFCLGPDAERIELFERTTAGKIA